MNLYTYSVRGQQLHCFAISWADVLTMIQKQHGQDGIRATIYLEQREATAEELRDYELQNLRAEVEALRSTVTTLRESLKLANDTAEEHRVGRLEQMRLRRVEMTAYRGSVGRLRSELSAAVERSSELAGQAHDHAQRAGKLEILLAQARRARNAQSAMVVRARQALGCTRKLRRG